MKIYLVWTKLILFSKFHFVRLSHINMNKLCNALLCIFVYLITFYGRDFVDKFCTIKYVMAKNVMKWYAKQHPIIPGPFSSIENVVLVVEMVFVKLLASFAGFLSVYNSFTSHSKCSVSRPIWNSVNQDDYVSSIYQWLSARLQYLQCISNGDTIVLH